MSAGDYLLVLVPGDRQLSRPKLRALAGGSTMAWPMAADSAMVGRQTTLGAGAHFAAAAARRSARPGRTGRRATGSGR